MGKKLYVGNLSFDATEDEVRNAFEGQRGGGEGGGRRDRGRW